MQVVAGFRFKVRFDLQKTTCAKTDHAELHDLCEVDVDDMVNLGGVGWGGVWGGVHILPTARFPVFMCVSAFLSHRSLPTVTPP